MRRKFDTIILGCGVSGLVAAKILTDKGHSVKVIDHYEDPGGNHITRIVDGMEFDVGSIYFNEQDDQFRHFPELKAVCLPRSVRLEKVSPTGQVSRYPISLGSDVARRGVPFMVRSLASLTWAKLCGGQGTGAEREITAKLGRYFLFESGLAGYMQRLMGIPVDEVSGSFVARRMQWVMRQSISAVLWRSVRGRFRRSKRPVQVSTVPQNGTRPLFRPPGGFAAYYGLAVAVLRDRGVDFALGRTIDRIARDENGFHVVSGECEWRADMILSTFPVALTSALAGLPAPDIEAVTLVTLMVAFTGRRRFTGEVFFNFHPSGGWKRVTMMSAIYGTIDGEEYMSVECPLPSGTTADPEALYAEFVAHVTALKLFDGTFRLAGTSTLSHAYPVLKIGYEAEQVRALAALSALGIETAGRQGKFDYIPHSSLATRLVEAQLSAASTKQPQLL